MDELCQLQALLLWALTIPQVSALRDIVEIWDESSGGFLSVPERRPGPKGDPGERGPPGKEVSVAGGCSVEMPYGGHVLTDISIHPSPHRAPLVFLENAG